MSMHPQPSALKEIIEEVDEDGSGYLEFEEFCSLRCKQVPMRLVPLESRGKISRLRE